VIINKYFGKCSCGEKVFPGKGQVINRKIICSFHADIINDSKSYEKDYFRNSYEDIEIYGFDDV
jgi:hypothetical protein